MKTFKSLAFTGLIFIIPALHAEGGPKPLEPFKTELELGVIDTSGNTESTSLKGKAILHQDFREWKSEYLIDALYDKAEYDGVTQTTAQKLFISAQSDYKLTSENKSIFVYGSYTDDRLSGYDYQNILSVGYADLWFSNLHSTLNYSVGPGYSFYRTDDGDKNKTPIFRLEVKYQYNISPTAKFTQILSIEKAFDSDENSPSKSETAISTKIRDGMSLKAAYTVTHNSQVLDDVEKTDAVTSLTLAYEF
jgi:putative salt-induced outer membrane protein YdiY